MDPSPDPARDELEREIQRFELLADWLDTRFRLPILGVRFGLDPLIGLIPVVGDVLGLGFSAWIIGRARRHGAPASLHARMLVNAGIDAVVGFVPFLGDVLDVGWRANAKNARLLLGHLLEQRGQIEGGADEPVLVEHEVVRSRLLDNS